MNTASIGDPTPAPVALARAGGASQQGFLGPGAQCRYKGRHWTVQSWTGTTVVLDGLDGTTCEALLWELVHEVHEHLLEGAAERGNGAVEPSEKEKWADRAELTIDSPGAAGWLLELLPEGDAAALQEQVEHMEEVRCGYRRGNASLALPHEPRAEYAAGTTMNQRLTAKAAQLGMSRFHCSRLLAAYEARSAAGAGRSRDTALLG